MSESVYKVIELVGTSTESWEKAAMAAVNLASLRAQIAATEGIIQIETNSLGVVRRQFDLGGASRRSRHSTCRLRKARSGRIAPR